jgi:translation initiation factor IF-2
MSGKRRVYELARELEIDNKALISALESLGVSDVRNHMSVVAPEDEIRVRRQLSGDSPKAGAEAEDPNAKRRVVVRRRKASDGSSEESAVEAPPERPSPVVQPVAAAPVLEARGPTVVPQEAPAARPHEGVRAEAPSREEIQASEPQVAPKAIPDEVVVPTSNYVGAPPIEVAAPPELEEEPAPPARAEPPVEPAPPPERPASDEPKVIAPIAPAPPRPETVSRPAPRPEVAPAVPAAAAGLGVAVAATSAAPKRGIEVWEGRPGVSMQNHRAAPRRVQYDAKAPPGPAGGPRRGPVGPSSPSTGGPPGSMGGPGRFSRGSKQRGIGSFGKARGAGAPVTKERSAHKKVVRIEESVLLQTLAANMGVKATDLLRKLFQLGMTGININSTLDADTAKIVGGEFGWDIEDVAVSEAEQLQQAQGQGEEEDPELLKPRAPVVTVMGHVDHGKTSLLDALRQTNVVSGEAGGITQHIGAYSVETAHGPVTFLDTPGHAAFTAMRARGAQATDVVVLVVAADDGVMPQTVEAISHAKAANVPIIVAINKIDKPDAQPERVRRELSEHGLVPEEWGGDTLFCEVSAKTRVGIDELLEKLALQSEMLELRANPDKPASGLVIESQLDRGRGPVATVLVTDGTLRPGDVILAGPSFGKVRAMLDWRGHNLKEVGPGGPAAIVGLSEVPRAGDQVYAMKDLKAAQTIAETRRVKERKSLAPSVGNRPRTLDEIAKLMSESDQLELKVIVKADVAGSAEAVSDSLQQLSTEKVKVSIVLQAAGAITENDVNLAVAAGAIILGFNAKPAGKALTVAQREGIEIRQYSIIYNLLDDVKLAMEGLLAPKLVEKDIGQAEVRQTFRTSKSGTIAGCMVIEGTVRRGAGARLMREGEKVWEGKVAGLKRFKEDVREVKEGFECGISLLDMEEIHVGDVIVVFEVEHIKQSL